MAGVSKKVENHREKCQITDVESFFVVVLTPLQSYESACKDGVLKLHDLVLASVINVFFIAFGIAKTN